MMTRRGMTLCAGLSAFALPVLSRYALGLEQALGPGARSGWFALDTGTSRTLGENADMRFPACSTFKWLLAASVLFRVDHGEERLDRRVAFGTSDLLMHSPSLEHALAHGERGLTIGALCEAAITMSDNGAANLLLASINGPEALTRWLRAHGDNVTRMARREPALNRVAPDEIHDTTTPRTMVNDLRLFVYGDVLSPKSRNILLAWMLGAKVGQSRMPAGLPAGWRVGHKTGTWREDDASRTGLYPPSCGDVGVLLPPSGRPVLMAIYVYGSDRTQAEVDAWIASRVRSAIDDISGSRR